MSTTETVSLRGSNKRKPSEQPDDAGPSSKKARHGEEDENAVAGRDPMQENDPSKSPVHPAQTSKEKKKRRKKKRKVSVVQQNGAGPQPAAAGDVPPARAREEATTEMLLPTEQESVAGPSRSSPPSVTSNAPNTAPSRQPSPARKMFTKDEKGKGRATSPVIPNSTEHENAKALTAHRALISNMLPSLTCHICLLLMSRPFALAPCGHVSCHSCLVNWFSNEPGVLGQAVAQAEPPPPPAPEVPNLPGAAAAANANVPQLPVAGPPPLVRRKKTCPQCRAVVREKPVEVWSIKDMVTAVVRSGLADPDSVPFDLREDAPPTNDASNADPWKDIFLSREEQLAPFANLVMREHMGIRDEADEGVYRCVDCTHEILEGECSHCGRIYPGHARIDYDTDSADGEDIELEQLWMHDDLDDDEDDFDHLNFIQHLVDAENLGQIGLGPHDLDEVVDDEEDEDEDDESDYSGDDMPHHLRPVRQRIDMPLPSDESNDEDSDVHNHEGDGAGSDSEGYESSFIDDDGGNDDDVVVVSGPSRRAAGRAYSSAIVISDSDSDDEEESANVRPTGTRPQRLTGLERLRRRVIEGSSDSEAAEDLAAEVAAREQDMYGDDGSLPPRHMRQRYDGDSGDDEDDEDEF